MSSTLTRTCPLCGLGYSNQALLELHIRDDHPRNRPAAEEPQHDAGSRPANEGDNDDSGAAAPPAAFAISTQAARPGIHALGKLGRQLAGRMAARFSLQRPRPARGTEAVSRS